jgi:hypothetical protein
MGMDQPGHLDEIAPSSWPQGFASLLNDRVIGASVSVKVVNSGG